MSATATRTGARPSPATQCTAIDGGALDSLSDAFLGVNKESQSCNHEVRMCCGGGSPSVNANSCAHESTTHVVELSHTPSTRCATQNQTYVHLNALRNNRRGVVGRLARAHKMRHIVLAKLLKIELQVAVGWRVDDQETTAFVLQKTRLVNDLAGGESERLVRTRTVQTTHTGTHCAHGDEEVGGKTAVKRGEKTG